MTTPEGKVKAKVKAVLAKHGAYYHMAVLNGMGAPTLDFTGCWYGHYFAVETKAKGRHLTQRQVVTAQRITLCGGRVFVIDDEKGCKDLDTWLAALDALQPETQRIAVLRRTFAMDGRNALETQIADRS